MAGTFSLRAWFEGDPGSTNQSTSQNDQLDASNPRKQELLRIYPGDGGQ